MIHIDPHRVLLLCAFVGLARCSSEGAAGSSTALSGTASGGPAAMPGSPGAGQAPPPGIGAGLDGEGLEVPGSAPMEPPPPPPEVEVETSFRVPVATGSFVWAANPDSGRVALVHARTLEVRTMDAGLEPTFLAAVPTADGESENSALVLNAGSADATYFREDDSGRIQTQTIAVHTDANAWAVSDSGRFAIAWSDATRIEGADSAEGFQDITVLDLSTEPVESTRLSVGYRPSQIVIRNDEEEAYVIAESSISIVSLTGTPSVPRDVILESTLSSAELARDVSITDAGDFALVRTDESPFIDVIRLSDGEVRQIELAGAVTDLDLTDGGTRGVAVVRETSQVALIPVPEIFDDPMSLELHDVAGTTVGSVALPAEGEQALLFTNAVDSEWLTLFELDSADQRSVALKSAVRAVFPLDDASFAIALLNPGDNSARQGAFAVVPVGTSLPPKIQGTDAPPIAVATLSDPARALVTVRSQDGVFGTYLVRMPELQVDFVRLSNQPLATGIVADEQVGFVAQEHPEGRITFIDLVTGEDRTLTGFELASRVIDGE